MTSSESSPCPNCGRALEQRRVPVGERRRWSRAERPGMETHASDEWFCYCGYHEEVDAEEIRRQS